MSLHSHSVRKQVDYAPVTQNGTYVVYCQTRERAELSRRLKMKIVEAEQMLLGNESQALSPE
jgi:hypothetical protein